MRSCCAVACRVFVDVRADTLNLDEKLIEDAITQRTRAIVPVHYAGVSCNMDAVMTLAKSRELRVVEDAAQGVMASYRNRALGSLGDLGTFSFHETKNVICGEGGALLVNDAALATRAEVLREKGTDRSRFLRGQVDKYTWQDLGSSFLPGEITAAFLAAQLEQAVRITEQRMASWDHYHELLAAAEARGQLRRPIVPADCQHNAHMYYVLLNGSLDRQQVLQTLREAGIQAVFHYVPLHSSAGGTRFGRPHGSLAVTDRISEQLIRLPLWIGIDREQQAHVVSTLERAISQT